MSYLVRLEKTELTLVSPNTQTCTHFDFHLSLATRSQRPTRESLLAYTFPSDPHPSSGCNPVNPFSELLFRGRRRPSSPLSPRHNRNWPIVRVMCRVWWRAPTLPASVVAFSAPSRESDNPSHPPWPSRERRVLTCVLKRMRGGGLRLSPPFSSSCTRVYPDLAEGALFATRSGRRKTASGGARTGSALGERDTGVRVWGGRKDYNDGF